MKVMISHAGKAQAKMLGLNVPHSMDNILVHVPKLDMLGLHDLLVTDAPKTKNVSKINTAAAYIPKYQRKPPRIEIYLKRLYGPTRYPEVFRIMIPIKEHGLAQDVYHEVGHHVCHTRTHGIKKGNGEKFAERYADNLMTKYIIENAGDSLPGQNSGSQVPVDKDSILNIKLSFLL